MGAGNSKKQVIEQTFKTDILNKEIQNFISNNSQTVSAAGYNTQTGKVRIGGDVYGCDIMLQQNINSKTTSTGVLDVEQLAELQKMVESKLKTEANAELDKSSQMGTVDFGSKSNQEVKTEVETIITNVSEQTFSQNNYNEILSTQTNTQDMDFEIAGNIDCREGGGIDLKQDITSQIVAKALTESMMDAFVEAELTANIITESETTVTSSDEGFAGLADSVLGGIGDIVGNIFGSNAFIIIAIVVAVLGFIFLLLKSGGMKGGRKSSFQPTQMPQMPQMPQMAMGVPFKGK